MSSSETPASAPNYRGLLTIVILLGALIMLAVGALIAGAFLVGRKPDLGLAFSAQIEAPGAHIESAELQGNRIVVKLAGGNAGEEVVILDAATGHVVGRIGVK